MSDKPREFKLTVNPASVTGAIGINHIEAHNCVFIPGEIVHVIEYSAFEQLRAERDFRITESNRTSGIFCQEINALRSQLKIAREALEFYSNPDRYDLYPAWGKVCIQENDCETGVREPFMDIKCGGKRAREALKQLTEK